MQRLLKVRKVGNEKVLFPADGILLEEGIEVIVSRGNCNREFRGNVVLRMGECVVVVPKELERYYFESEAVLAELPI